MCENATNSCELPHCYTAWNPPSLREVANPSYSGIEHHLPSKGLCFECQGTLQLCRD